MPEDAPRPAQAAIRTDLGAIFVPLELSRRSWLITFLSPGGGEKMSPHSVPASDVAGLLRRFAELRRKAAGRTGLRLPRLPTAARQLRAGSKGPDVLLHAAGARDLGSCARFAGLCG
jgi:hypothetical protein